MKPELDRVRNDIDTIQKAMGLAPSFGRDWIQCLKRDNWLNLWWCVPGLILVVSAWVPFDDSKAWLGLLASQWVGLLAAAALLGIGVLQFRMMSNTDKRPLGLVREYKRINTIGLASVVPIVFYFIWGKQHAIGGEAFTAGLFVVSGSMVIVTVATKLWVFMGWAIPLVAFGLCQPLMSGGKSSGVGIGLVFISAALLCSVIQAWHVRRVEKQHDAH